MAATSRAHCSWNRVRSRRTDYAPTALQCTAHPRAHLLLILPVEVVLRTVIIVCQRSMAMSMFMYMHVHIPSELELQTGEPPVQSSASPSKLCAMCPSGVIAFGIIATDRRCAQQAARSGTQSLNNDPQLAELTGSDGIVSCV